MSSAPSGSPRKKSAERTAITRRVREMFDPRLQFQRLVREIRSNVPGFLVSLGVHLAIALVLMLMIIQQQVKQTAISVIGRFMGEEETAPNAADQPLEIPEITVIKPTPSSPATAKTENKAPIPASLNPGSVPVQGALSGRAPEARQDLARKYGGTPDSEKAVKLGLDWLKRVQDKKDGRWRLDDAVPSLKTDTGATALALLCFLGGGHTHREGLYQKEVGRGMDFLIGQQREDGNLYEGVELGHQQSFYAHGQGAIVLCEAYGMTHDEKFKAPAEKAIKYILESQHPTKGGWKYRPISEGDLSVFGWQLMALQSARMSGLEVPENALSLASSFLDLVQMEGGARYRYENVAERVFTPAMTAEGLLCRQYLGWPREHPALQNGIQYITSAENLPSWTDGRRNVYFWYYATQVLHNTQGEPWERWNKALQQAIVNNQIRGGANGGSWNPVRGAPEEHSDKAGRLYLTSLCVLTLEVYYRHLPLYKDPPPAAGG